MLAASRQRLQEVQKQTQSNAARGGAKSGGAGGADADRGGSGGGADRSGAGVGGVSDRDGARGTTGEVMEDDDDIVSPMPRRVQRVQRGSEQAADEGSFQMKHAKVTKKLGGQILTLRVQMNVNKPGGAGTFSATHVLGEEGFDVATLSTFQVGNINVVSRSLDFWCTRGGSDLAKARVCINSGLFSLALALMVTFSGERIMYSCFWPMSWRPMLTLPKSMSRVRVFV